MSYLPLANIFHRKLRSVLCMLAVAIGIAMLVVMLGLSHGTLNEVAQRMESVPAELLVLPRGESAIYMGGGTFGQGHEELIRETAINGQPAVKRIIPVFWLTDNLAGQKQRIYGVDHADAATLFGNRPLLEGRLFDPEHTFANAVQERAVTNGAYDTDAMPAELLEAGLEIVIDRRLQEVGGYRLNDRVPMLGRTFTIVGIVETGVVGRVFAPIQTLRHIATTGIHRSTMFFVQLTDPDSATAVTAAIEDGIGAQVVRKDSYRQILYESFSQV